MPVNYYPNATEAELVALLESLQRRQTVGQPSFIIAAGMQQQSSWQNSDKVSVTMRRILYALHLLNSEDYDNPYVARVRRTQANYVSR